MIVAIVGMLLIFTAGYNAEVQPAVACICGFAGGMLVALGAKP